MGIGKRIKEARERLGLTQNELGELVGVTGSAITNYEKETSHPKEIIMYRLFEALHVDANYLFQDVVDIPKGSNDVTLSEYEHIKKYRLLDTFGKETVNYIMEREISRALSLQNAQHQIAAISDQGLRASGSLRIYTYLRKIASAGKGFYFDDIPTDIIEAPQKENADFIIGVSGESMEPTFHDGDLVYVQKCQIVQTGEIGIFILNGECLIKEAGENELISHNHKYAPIPGNDNIICIGKVLGKVILSDKS